MLGVRCWLLDVFGCGSAALRCITTYHFQWGLPLSLPSSLPAPQTSWQAGRAAATRLLQRAGRGIKGTAIEFKRVFGNFSSPNLDLHACPGRG